MTIDISQNSLKHDCNQLDFFPSLPTTNTFDAHGFKIMQKKKIYDSCASNKLDTLIRRQQTGSKDSLISVRRFGTLFYSIFALYFVSVVDRLSWKSKWCIHMLIYFLGLNDLFTTFKLWDNFHFAFLLLCHLFLAWFMQV